MLNGRFCDNKKCVESKTPEAIGGFVIHMHCAHCDDILETVSGYFLMLLLYYD